MSAKIFHILFLALVIALSFVTFAHAGKRHCAHCGRHACCEKVCRLVREDKKVEIVCWGCECEDFCVPGHSEPGCKHCKTVCASCGGDGEPCAEPKRFVWTEWVPGCATIFTKKKLMKKTVTEKVPSFTWVVEDLCSHCEDECECAAIEPDTALPPPPVADAKLKYRQVKAAPLGENTH